LVIHSDVLSVFKVGHYPGLWVCAKRLERGRFTWPVSDHGQVSLRGEEFSALIHGLEVRTKAGWYRR
jgi:transposase